MLRDFSKNPNLQSRWLISQFRWKQGVYKARTTKDGGDTVHVESDFVQVFTSLNFKVVLGRQKAGQRRGYRTVKIYSTIGIRLQAAGARFSGCSAIFRPALFTYWPCLWYFNFHHRIWVIESTDEVVGSNIVIFRRVENLQNERSNDFGRKRRYVNWHWPRNGILCMKRSPRRNWKRTRSSFFNSFATARVFFVTFIPRAGSRAVRGIKRLKISIERVEYSERNSIFQSFDFFSNWQIVNFCLAARKINVLRYLVKRYVKPNDYRSEIRHSYFFTEMQFYILTLNNLFKMGLNHSRNES